MGNRQHLGFARCVMGNSEEKYLPDKGLSDLNFSSFVLTCVLSAIFVRKQANLTFSRGGFSYIWVTANDSR
jgi:hypothetical protein